MSSTGYSPDPASRGTLSAFFCGSDPRCGGYGSGYLQDMKAKFLGGEDVGSTSVSFSVEVTWHES